MNSDDLVEGLGYDGSDAFLQSESDYSKHAGYTHVFRQAKETLNLRGVFTLREPSKASSSGSIVPLVYVCDAIDERHAARIQKGVWNQNIAPFLLVATPNDYRLYSGFKFESDPTKQKPLELQLKSVRTALQAFDDFNADAINDGRIWQKWREHVTPSGRVDWNLLRHLEDLGDWLRKRKLGKETSHALIGKYVFLHYLRDRNILSDRKLETWEIKPDAFLGRAATRQSLLKVIDKLDDWLNGSIFPLQLTGDDAPTDEHVQQVAAVFSGDETSGQQHLDFSAYDFSHIPIETLSVVYQQFLHAEGKGRQHGAYYTPPHLVSFVLDEMDAAKPLRKGMSALDPACGSGAFLVQCYRRIVERELYERKGTKIRPVELRSLLTDHIFGVEQNADACKVAGLSLVLAMLDYVDPPDLEGQGNFKLPNLAEKNIFKGDFFAKNTTWERRKYDWVVGNPPWKAAGAGDQTALTWMTEHETKHPVGGKQLAEAFAWKAALHAADGGQVGLLMPAMSLFKEVSKGFRKCFFEQMDVSCVVNFAHLVQVLFSGRVNVPAAALFYSPHGEKHSPQIRKSTLTYAPFLVNQEANRAAATKRKQASWCIIVNASEVRELSWAELSTGESSTWKIAMWGSARDKSHLDRLKRRFPSFKDFASNHGLIVHEGFEPTDSGGRPMKMTEEERAKHKGASVFPLPSIIGEKKLDIAVLRNCGRLYEFPKHSLKSIPSEFGFVSKRAGTAGLEVCYAPHFIIDRARRFAVFTDDFIVVPARQIGVSGPCSKRELLIALALFLTSDIAYYLQFFESAEWGIQKSVADKKTLEVVPIPDRIFSDREIGWWVDAYAKLAAAVKQSSALLRQQDDTISNIENQINERAADALGLRQTEKLLVSDFMKVRRGLTRGKVTDRAVCPAADREIKDFGDTLVNELDGFMDEETKRRHFVRVIRGGNFAVIEIIRAIPKDRRPHVEIGKAGINEEAELKKIQELLRKRHQSQWFYFDRGLRIYNAQITYLFKPLQRLHWLRSQALADADEIIAEHVSAPGRKD